MIRRDEDRALTRLYEESGLFAKIIDAPAEIKKRQGEKTEIEAVRKPWQGKENREQPNIGRLPVFF